MMRLKNPAGLFKIAHVLRSRRREDGDSNGSAEQVPEEDCPQLSKPGHNAQNPAGGILSEMAIFRQLIPRS